MEQKKIIYLMGAGRSGTTLLEIILGNGQGVFNCGELNRFPEYDGIPKLSNSGNSVYDFWSSIKRSLLPRHNLKQQEQLHKKFEYHKGIRSLFVADKTQDFSAYATYLKDMYASIFQNVEENIITDSSKYPLRGYHLTKVLPYEVCFVYLKRDPAAVVRSFAKKDVEQPSKNWVAANLYYFLVNALCKLVLKKIARRHQVVEIKYDDLLANPRQALLHIQEKIGIDLSPAIHKIENDASLDIGLLFDGNRIRLNKNIKLKRKTVNPQKSNSGIDQLSRALNYVLYR